MIHQRREADVFRYWLLDSQVGLQCYTAYQEFKQLQPAQLCEFIFTNRQLKQVELVQRLPLTATQRIILMYLHELIIRAQRFVQLDIELFALYQQTLLAISTHSSFDLPLRQFELRLLAMAGLAVDFNYDAAQQPIVAQHSYQYVAERGWVAGDEYRGQELIALKSIFQLSMNESQTQLLKNAKRLTQQLLPQIIGAGDIHTRALWKQERAQ